MKYIYSLLLLSFSCILSLHSQVINSAEAKKTNTANESVYDGQMVFYPVKKYPQEFKSPKPKNVILMIGDGMGLSAISGAITANGGSLFLDNFKHIGFSKTQSADRYVTDSAAGGTAIASGQKTKNGTIGLNANGDTIQSILKAAQSIGLGTGIINVNEILDATPAAFYAHSKKRSEWESIASQLLDANIDIMIGGNSQQFTERFDNRNLLKEFEDKKYSVYQTLEELANTDKDKIIALFPPRRASERNNQLDIATRVALNKLDKHNKGFFLMIEGSYIDGGGHRNDMTYLMEELLDFDRAIGQVLEYAANDGETLVIVTADHETGGVSIVKGDKEDGSVTARFATTGHSGTMVPIFAYGPGAENFTGINENTFFFEAIAKLLGIEFNNQ